MKNWTRALADDRPKTVRRRFAGRPRQALILVATIAGLMPTAAHAYTVAAPTTVTPGQTATFRLSGLDPHQQISSVIVQAGAFIGSNSGAVAVDGPWTAGSTGKALVTFPFPTAYLTCAGANDCRENRWDDPVASVYFSTDGSSPDVRVKVSGVASPASPTVTKRPKPSRAVTLSTMFVTNATRPKTMHLWARDAFLNVKWVHWGAKQASATGRVTFSSPDGSTTYKTGRLVVSRIRTCNGRRVYTRIRYKIADGRWTTGRFRNCRLSGGCPVARRSS